MTLDISSSDPTNSNNGLSGSFAEIIYPVYRELRKFGTPEHKELSWSDIRQERFEELKIAVKKIT